MMTPIELVPLKCINCDALIPADQDEVAWVCESCGQGQQLVEEGLAPLQIHYARRILPSKVGRPFWVCDGQVQIQRDVYPIQRPKTADAEDFWSLPRRFVIPAFKIPLDDLTRLGSRYLLEPPYLQEGKPVKFETVTFSPADIPALVEFIVIAVEAERRDKVKSIQMKIELEDPELWILP
jgi:hypothetical protein